jgi:peptide/nickel transport system permease protein
MSAISTFQTPRKVRTGLRATIKTVLRNRTLTFGIILMTIILLAVLIGPILSPYDAITQDVKNTFANPSSTHWLGTDNFGRDTLTRILEAGRYNLQFALVATILSVVSGSILGALAGYKGGWIDAVLMRLVDVLIAFPGMVLVIAMVAVLGTGTLNMYAAVAVIGWIPYARIVRGQILVEKEKEYVAAATVIGVRTGRIILRHLLPNVFSTILVYATSDMVVFVMFAAGLGFLGLGIQPPQPEWGTMVADGRLFILMNSSLTLYPGMAILITGIAFSLIGDGLAEFLRPSG